MAKKDSEETPLEKANEQGFLGEKVDPTPDENYTVAGVTKDKPTPETDPKAAAEAQAAAGLDRSQSEAEK
jgi:hypothetical protein